MMTLPSSPPVRLWSSPLPPTIRLNPALPAIQPIHFPKDGVVTVPVQDKNQEYEIIAYVNHLGMTMNEGHYTTDVKILDKNAWINFNDDKVKQMTPENPEKDAYMVLLRKK